MTDLYRRILLWHKLTAMVTGGLSLCSAKHRLSRTEALDWVTSLRNVADEIDSIVRGGSFLLDDKGRRVVGSETVSRADAGQEVFHVKPGVMPDTDGPPVHKPAGGPRVVKRKRT